MMNVASERARAACDACRKSHKRCAYDGNSTSCARCEQRNKPCSLFPSVETTAVAQEGPPALVTTESAPDSQWGGTPHDSAISPNFPYQFFPPQGPYYVPNPVFAEATQGEYPADMVFAQSFVDQHESAQPGANQDGLYEDHNVFQ